MLVRLLRLERGDKRYYAPRLSIEHNSKLREILARLLKLVSGDKRNYASRSLI